MDEDVGEESEGGDRGCEGGEGGGGAGGREDDAGGFEEFAASATAALHAFAIVLAAATGLAAPPELLGADVLDGGLGGRGVGGGSRGGSGSLGDFSGVGLGGFKLGLGVTTVVAMTVAVLGRHLPLELLGRVLETDSGSGLGSLSTVNESDEHAYRNCE